MAASSAFQITEGTVPATPSSGILAAWANTLHIPMIIDPNATQSVNLAEQWCIQTATQTSSSNTGPQNWFPSNAVSTVAVNAATTYQFEGLLNVATGATTHTTALLFNLTTATLTSIKYFFCSTSVAENAVGAAPQVGVVNVATSTVINTTSTALGANHYIRGFMRVNAGGTIAPQFTWSQSPAGTQQVLINTFFRIWPIGDNTSASIGKWT